MAIVAMRHLRLIGLQSEREEILQKLQHLGCLEVIEPALEEDDPLLQQLHAPVVPVLGKAREQFTAAEQALQTLGQYAPKQKQGLAPQPEITERQLTDPQEIEQCKNAARRLNEMRQRIQILQAHREKLTAEYHLLQPWSALEMPLQYGSTEQVLIQLGTLPAAISIQQAQDALRQNGELYELREVSADRERRYCILAAHASEAEAHLAELKSLGWSRISLGQFRGTAAENLAAIQKEQQTAEQEIAKLENSIAQSVSQKPELQQLSDAARIDIDRAEAQERMLDTASAFLLEGWFPAENTKELEMLLEGCTCAWQMTDPAPEDYPRVPVLLKNNWFTRSLNMVTEMYSLPAYGTLDPNPLMAPFFILFYGIMMADMGYGLLMFLAGLIISRKYRPKGTMGHMFGLMTLCGVSTFIMGALTGGFFGDFLTQVVKLTTGGDFALPALFTPLNDTLMILVGAMCLGLVQIVTGMAISFIRKLKAGQYLDALFEEVTWWVVFAGIGCMALGVTNLVLYAGIVLIFAGPLITGKGFGKIMGIFGSLYNHITGYFGDILSYARLMALMLAGSVIAQVFNTLGAIPGNIVIFIIISLAGNALNFALNLLGCYVHDLRLQCLEYFGKFYEDGGKPFRPLAMQTKYVDIE